MHRAEKLLGCRHLLITASPAMARTSTAEKGSQYLHERAELIYLLDDSFLLLRHVRFRIAQKSWSSFLHGEVPDKSGDN